jgi:hypothetical protein
MKFYLAARYNRNAEMRAVRDDLFVYGHTITSRWIDQHDGALLESIVQERLNSEPQNCAKYAQVDISDIRRADAVISFTSIEGGGKGGRHVEFGVALALQKMLVIVGPRENIFHTLGSIRHFPEWNSCKEWLRTEFN